MNKLSVLKIIKGIRRLKNKGKLLHYKKEQYISRRKYKIKNINFEFLKLTY